MNTIAILLSMAAVILLTSAFFVEAKTERFASPAEKKEPLASNQAPEIPLHPKESQVTPPASMQLDAPKHFQKRDEISDYEGWENKQRKK